MLVTRISSCRRRSHCRSSCRTLASSAPNGSSSSSTLGSIGQGPRQGHALALAAGKLRGIAIFERVEPDERATARGRDSRLLLGPAAHLQAEGHVVEDRHVAKQRVMLKHEADVPLAGRLAGDIFVFVIDRARIGGF